MNCIMACGLVHAVVSPYYDHPDGGVLPTGLIREVVLIGISLFVMAEGLKICLSVNFIVQLTLHASIY